MCGIAGAVNFKLSRELVKEKMFHRGPDEQAGYSEHNIDFYHLRLSILDISGGKQPMRFGDRYTIIFNGQVYNHQQLRKQFGLDGHTSSDTETLLMLYHRLGTNMLDYLDGMFVFAIYDNVERNIFIARDRAGKKPLYYYNDRSKFVFASELNCLKASLDLQMEPNNFLPYTRIGAFYRGMTPYKQVIELEGGYWLKVNCSTCSVRKHRWWNMKEQYVKKNDDSLEEALAKTEGFLHNAVRQRLESSDLEVGSFLSGGIDSGLVTAIGSSYNNKLKTFTVSFDGEYDEAPLAKLVADKYQTTHTEIKISFDHLKDDLEQILCNYGEPFFDSSAIPSYYVSREARKYLTVIVNGDGADELFGGYRRYVPFSRYDFFKKNAFVKNAATFAKRLMPPSNNKKSKYNYLYRLASLASKSDLEIYLSAGVDIMEDFEENIISPPGLDYMNNVRADFERITDSKLSGLKKIMCMDFDCNLFSDLLVKMDIATMASSLEGRSPFLCKDILEYAPGMNDKFKVNGGTTKFLLRQLAKKYLPEQLVDQPKRGFEIPLKNWVEHELKDMLFDYVGSSNALNRQFINPDFTQKVLNKKIRMSAEKRAKILWMMLCMEVWYKKVYLNA